jgi:SAM-dependent methyltransferase
MKCRHCATGLTVPLIDLGTAPPSNAYLRADQLQSREAWYPLRVLVCTGCWLAQTEDFAQADQLFDAEYAYFSSYSDTWLAHAEALVATMVQRMELGPTSHVVEVAANDGYLLQFVQRRGIPCLGVEPTASTAAAARAKGIIIEPSFFGSAVAMRLRDSGKAADLLIANNVLAHVPDINDFVAGFAILLKPDGLAVFEFPHLQRLITERLFDTIYHEHYSYLSLTAVDVIFRRNGLVVVDVEDLTTHGGSLRVHAQRADVGRRSRAPAVDAILARERLAGLMTQDFYAGLQGDAECAKHDLLRFLLDERRAGRKVGAYGAAAKGNTLLNWAGVRSDLLPWVADRSPAKQGRWLPGSRIPVVDEDHLRRERPDTILILPWNLRAEITQQLSYARDWGAHFATAVPRMEVR